MATHRWGELKGPHRTLVHHHAMQVIIIIFGTICSAMFGNHEETTYTVDSLKVRPDMRGPE